MPSSRVVVFGYGELALAAIDALEQVDADVASMVVPGNRQGGDVALVRSVARSRGLTLLTQPPKAQLPRFLDEIRALEPDVLLVWSYSMILPPELLAIPRMGAVNVHGGLLPEYRGGHVMNWALINGERESGATLHYMDAGIDTGPVIAERRFLIDRHDDAASVRGKLLEAGQVLLETWWPAIADGTAPRTPQDESRAHYYPMRVAEDGLIDWTQSSAAIYNLVRALVAPWPGAFTFVADTKLVVRRLRQVAISPCEEAAGTVTCCDQESVVVATGSGAVELLAVEIDGRPAGLADLRRVGMTAGVRLR